MIPLQDGTWTVSLLTVLAWRRERKLQAHEYRLSKSYHYKLHITQANGTGAPYGERLHIDHNGNTRRPYDADTAVCALRMARQFRSPENYCARSLRKGTSPLARVCASMVTSRACRYSEDDTYLVNIWHLPLHVRIRTASLPEKASSWSWCRKVFVACHEKY
ncbi:hypothetical protein PR048_018108 [Dryococelus australis]|uniref:Uncharacterized protein n=1 Tax=Dryococelus australis TaxID=614101 RepID=A0ABQ9HBC3_9NEOP|nr:hypothetical protein PR048_018108 [Dryococelus australis]